MKYWLSFLIVFFTLQAEPQIVVPHLSNQTLEKICAFDRQHPTGNYSIYVQREYSWWSNLKNSCSSSPSSSSLWSWIKSTAGVTTLGYAVLFYNIYKAYKIIKKISLWVSCFTNNDNDDEMYKHFYTVRSNKQRYQEFMSEYEHMKNYLHIDQLLKAYGIRSFFPRDKVLDTRIAQTVVSLEKIMKDTKSG